MYCLVGARTAGIIKKSQMSTGVLNVFKGIVHLLLLPILVIMSVRTFNRKSWLHRVKLQHELLYIVHSMIVLIMSEHFLNIMQ